MSSLSIANYDARKYPLGPPYDGTRGAAYRSWCDVILTALSMYDLKDPNEIYDLSETAIGQDDNGVFTPPGAGAPLALPAANTAAGRRRARRIKTLYALLFSHVDNSERLRYGR